MGMIEAQEKKVPKQTVIQRRRKRLLLQQASPTISSSVIFHPYNRSTTNDIHNHQLPSFRLSRYALWIGLFLLIQSSIIVSSSTTTTPTRQQKEGPAAADNNNNNNNNNNNRRGPTTPKYATAPTRQFQRPTTPRNLTSSTTQNKRQQQDEIPKQQQQQSQEERFMTWCKDVLGIETILEIHTFEYYDYMSALLEAEEEEYYSDDDEFLLMLQRSQQGVDDSSYNYNNNNNLQQQDKIDMIPVRGLRASKDIQIGDIVIRIPLRALVTVSTTIDQDPVLNRFMGPEARRKYGWQLLGEEISSSSIENNSNDEDNNEDDQNAQQGDNDDFFELSLLAVALLHHRKLGISSPLYEYIQMLESNIDTNYESMPYLWDKTKLKTASEGIRTVAKSIRKDMQEMYHVVVDVLVRDYPNMFGKPTTGTKRKSKKKQQQHNDTNKFQNNKTNDKEKDVAANTTTTEKEKEEEWMFSYKQFQWAFAMVNSRHWQLPFTDQGGLIAAAATATANSSRKLDQQPTQQQEQQQEMIQQHEEGSLLDGIPASMPTDAYIDGRSQQPQSINIEQTNNIQEKNQQQQLLVPQQEQKIVSFLAPVADLLNFGPPCTKVHYNNETHTFDITASCNIHKGEEVTFWYSDECEHIIIGNYGFTHPMVPKCPTAQDYHTSRDLWRQRTQYLQIQLEQAYEDLDKIDIELQNVQNVLEDCDCCYQNHQHHRHHKHEIGSGGGNNNSDEARRKARNHQQQHRHHHGDGRSSSSARSSASQKQQQQPRTHKRLRKDASNNNHNVRGSVSAEHWHEERSL